MDGPDYMRLSLMDVLNALRRSYITIPGRLELHFVSSLRLEMVLTFLLSEQSIQISHLAKFLRKKWLLMFLEKEGKTA